MTKTTRRKFLKTALAGAGVAAAAPVRADDNITAAMTTPGKRQINQTNVMKLVHIGAVLKASRMYVRPLFSTQHRTYLPSDRHRSLSLLHGAFSERGHDTLSRDTATYVSTWWSHGPVHGQCPRSHQDSGPSPGLHVV